MYSIANPATRFTLLLEFEGQSGEQGVSALRDCMSKHDSGARTDAGGRRTLSNLEAVRPFSFRFRTRCNFVSQGGKRGALAKIPSTFPGIV